MWGLRNLWNKICTLWRRRGSVSVYDDGTAEECVGCGGTDWRPRKVALRAANRWLLINGRSYYNSTTRRCSGCVAYNDRESMVRYGQSRWRKAVENALFRKFLSGVECAAWVGGRTDDEVTSSSSRLRCVRARKIHCSRPPSVRVQSRQHVYKFKSNIFVVLYA